MNIFTICYSQTIQSSPNVRWPVYYDVVLHAVDYNAVIEQMSMVNWEIREIMSQHNSYVDKLLKTLSKFKSALTQAVE